MVMLLLATAGIRKAILIISNGRLLILTGLWFHQT